MYGLRFGYSIYFFGGTGRILGKFNDFILGEFNDELFSCYAKSGGQNLWLPLKQDIGLKIFHPKGFSGTLTKAQKHFQAQSLLAEEKLSPKPFEIFEVEVDVQCDLPGSAVIPPCKCYGIMMERVLNGNVNQVLKNLRLFGVKRTRQTSAVIRSFVTWYGSDALTLADYVIFCRYFGVSEEEHLKEIIDNLEIRMPSVFRGAPDLLSLSNIVLDENGEAKVVDCDLSGL